jgi:hypothetical protein
MRGLYIGGAYSLQDMDPGTERLKRRQLFEQGKLEMGIDESLHSRAQERTWGKYV